MPVTHHELSLVFGACSAAKYELFWVGWFLPSVLEHHAPSTAFSVYVVARSLPLLHLPFLLSKFRQEKRSPSPNIQHVTEVRFIAANNMHASSDQWRSPGRKLPTSTCPLTYGTNC